MMGVSVLLLLISQLSLAIEIVQTTPGGGEVTIYQPNKCREMKVGERRQTNVGYEASPTGIPAYYTLNKLSDKNYSIDLNIAFWTTRDYDGDRGSFKGMAGSELDDHVDKIYRAKMSQCFKQYANKLKDSRGNTFRFQIPEEQFDTNRFAPSAERIYIEIGNASHRSNSTKYESDIDCPVMMHETLHLLGLCDEYHESSIKLLSDEEAKKRGFDPTVATAYDCRKVGPRDSIMANQYEALNDSYNVTTLYCSCLAADCKPKGFLEASKCPKGMKQSGSPSYTIMSEYDYNYYKKLIPNDMTVAVKAEKIPKTKSVLSNEQADVILHPGCEEKNGVYYQCAKDAYNTSVERGGRGCLYPACSGKTPSGWLDSQ